MTDLAGRRVNRAADHRLASPAAVSQMVEQAGLDAVFHALGHDARRQMLGRLAQGDLSMGELAAPLPMSLTSAAKHVRVLERAGLVHRSIQGRRHTCRLEPLPLARAYAWLGWYERHWNQQHDALDRLLRTWPAQPGQDR